MDKREVFKIINLKELETDLNMKKIFCFDFCVGYDHAVYLLLSAQPPMKEYGNDLQFKYKEYYAVRLKMDWEKQLVLNKEIYSLGKMPYEFCFLRPLDDDFLLIGDKNKNLEKEILYESDTFMLIKRNLLRECDISSDMVLEPDEKYGFLIHKNGRVIREYKFKKDISECQTTKEREILLDIEEWWNLNSSRYIESYDIEGNYIGKTMLAEKGFFNFGEDLIISEKQEKIMAPIKNPMWTRYREYWYDIESGISMDERLVQMEYQGEWVKDVPSKQYGSKMLFWLEDETIGGHFFKENNRIEVNDPSENRDVFQIVDLVELKEQYNIEEFFDRDCCVGYDQKVYILFCNKLSKVYKRLLQRTYDNRQYIVAELEIDWVAGKLLHTEIFAFDSQDYHFHAVRPLKENFLLLGWNDGERKKNTNGILMNKKGEILRKYFLGEGVGKCYTTKEGIIYTGHTGEISMNDPIATRAVNAWNEKEKEYGKIQNI
jgi:hypothetical protein